MQSRRSVMLERRVYRILIGPYFAWQLEVDAKWKLITQMPQYEARFRAIYTDE